MKAHRVVIPWLAYVSVLRWCPVVVVTHGCSEKVQSTGTAYKDFQFRLLGSTVWKNAFHIQATTETRKVVLSDSDLVAAGYQWRLIPPCHAILTFAGIDYPVYCSQSAIPAEQTVIDPVQSGG